MAGCVYKSAKTSATENLTWATWNISTASVTSTDCTWMTWSDTNEGTLWPRPTKEERKKKEAAKKRDTETLRKHLSPKQRTQYDKDNRFHVIGSDGKRYEVDCKRRMHNVFEIDKQGKRLVEHCIYQSGNTPLPDNHLAQKLMLETDAVEFLRIANQTRLAS